VNRPSLPKAVIFDVDGTLYDHARLKRLMLGRIAAFLLLHPWRAREIAVVRAFRKVQERLSAEGATGGLARAQYELAAERTGVPPERVREIVERWMHVEPLSYLRGCRHPGLPDFLTRLRDLGIHTAVFSDYPCAAKVRALGLSFECLADAQDPEIDRLKPDPRGLVVVARRLGVDVRDCLFVGDRDDKDGECARRAGMPYAILERRRRRGPSPHGFTSYSALRDRLFPCPTR
jgi:FMN phosphatase YigB (HAD superfamily)